MLRVVVVHRHVLDRLDLRSFLLDSVRVCVRGRRFCSSSEFLELPGPDPKRKRRGGRRVSFKNDVRRTS